MGQVRLGERRVLAGEVERLQLPAQSGINDLDDLALGAQVEHEPTAHPAVGAGHLDAAHDGRRVVAARIQVPRRCGTVAAGPVARQEGRWLRRVQWAGHGPIGQRRLQADRLRRTRRPALAAPCADRLE
jgi:hypothetical protein